MIEDDAPNIYIQKRMLDILRNTLKLKPQYKKVQARGLRWLLEKFHIINPRYGPIPELPTSKTLRIKRYSKLELPNDTEAQ